MQDLWNGLSATGQDLALLLALLAPAAAAGLWVTHGFAPWPLVRALLWRFRGTAAMFTLLIAVSVGCGIGLIAQERALREGSARAADRFDLVIAAPGSEVAAMLATVFLRPGDMPLLDGAAYGRVASHPAVALAAPLAFGDSAGGAPVVGTTLDFVRHLGGGPIEGRQWRNHEEALAGAATGLAIGARIVPAHGVGDAAEEGAHGAEALTVVGRLPRTGSPWDHAVIVPVETVWDIHGLANGHPPGDRDRIGPPFDPGHFPGTPAIVVRARSLADTYGLRSAFTQDRETMAFLPGAVLSQLHAILGDVRQAMSVLALVSQGLVATAVLLGLFTLTRLIRRQMSVLRALGAPGRFVFAVVWCFAMALLGTGALLGLGFGYGAAAALSQAVAARTDIAVAATLGWREVHLVAGFVLAAGIAALLPAAAVLRLPVVDGLRS